MVKELGQRQVYDSLVRLVRQKCVVSAFTAQNADNHAALQLPDEQLEVNHLALADLQSISQSRDML